MTFVDTVVLIDLFEGSAGRRQAAGAVFRSGGLVAASELIRSEALVLPIRNGDLILQANFYRTIGKMMIFPIDTAVLDRAAELRAHVPGLKTPDAIHAATALVHGASEFVTRDPGFRRVPGLNVTVLT